MCEVGGQIASLSSTQLFVVSKATVPLVYLRDQSTRTVVKGLRKKNVEGAGSFTGVGAATASPGREERGLRVSSDVVERLNRTPTVPSWSK
jgi:hypothetical protein